MPSANFTRDLLLFVPTMIYLIFRFALFAQSLEFKDRFDENYYVPFFAPVIFVTEFVWNGVLRHNDNGIDIAAAVVFGLFIFRVSHPFAVRDEFVKILAGL